MTFHEISLRDSADFFLNSKGLPKVVLSSDIEYGSLSSEKEIRTLATLCALQNPAEIFEIGTFNGTTTSLLAQNAPSADIYTLDLPREYRIDVPTRDKMHARADAIFINARQPQPIFKNTLQGKRIKELHGNSETFDFTPYKNKIDMVFVDAGHTFEYVLNDSHKAHQLMARKGLIVWHDYALEQAYCAEVVKVLNEYAVTQDLFKIRDTSLVFYKSQF